MKLHPLSVPYRVGTRAVKFGWAVAIGLAGVSSTPLFGRYAWAVAALVVAAGVGLVAREVAYYRRFDYRLAGTTLELRSGVLSRREREIPLHRIQNVDVSRNVVQRALGIGTVNVETAGGGETEAVLECVGVEEAERLQREIARLKRERAEGEAGEADEPAPGEAGEPGEVLFELDDRSLLLASALSFDARLASAVFLVQPFVWPALAPYLLRFGPAVLAAVAVAGVALLVAGLWIASAARTFARYYGFRLRRDGDDLRYERGLVQRYTGTIPTEKLQTLVVRENPLQRRFGYASLAVRTAGYAPGSGPSGGSEAAVPLAPRGDVVALARTLEPFEEPDLRDAPTRARRRYLGRYAIAVTVLLAVAAGANAVFPYPYWWVVAGLYALVPPAAHLQWTHLGHAVDGTHAFTRRGFWTRRTHVVPHHRVQTLVRRETVFQRRWGLASVVVDTAGGGGRGGDDAVAVDVEAERAATLVEAIGERVRDAIARRG